MDSASALPAIILRRKIIAVGTAVYTSVFQFSTEGEVLTLLKKVVNEI